ncbi:MAG: DUF86 domain-containing protein [Solirubrobacterales bacterium]|nr:DUF86 domain-containing protein [Solirubrobacterales bacterium]
MVDAESVATRLDRLTPLLEELEEIRAAGHDAYMADFRSRLAADHAIQLAVQICIDVGAHLIAELGLEVPSDYRGIFESLRSEGLDPQLAERLADAAGMRNILVHGYLEVDDEAVWGALDHLDDLRQFAAFTQRQIG